MANTYALVTNKGKTFVRNLGLVEVTVTVGDTYATATGGITLDFVDVLPIAGGAADRTVAFSDIIAAFGFMATGQMAYFTKGTTAAEFTVKLWNGTTEQSDGAVSGTLKAFLLVA